MSVDDINNGIIAVIIVIAWIALDWYGHRTGELNDDE